MKKNWVKQIAVMILGATLLTACGGQTDEFTGSWAYNHDPDTTIVKFYKDGEMLYEGKKYTYTASDGVLNLSDGSSSLKLRYEENKDGMLLYFPATFESEDQASSDSVVGTWNCVDNDWSFVFMENGEFSEDAIFPGNYTVDSSEGSIKLMYIDHFEDATLYYTMDGNRMVVEYPWQMVKR